MTTILVVEDDRDILEALECALEHEGYVILTAENGTEAIDVVKENKVDIIFLDHHMPGSTGEDFCRMRADENLCPDVPVILMSAVHDGEVRVKRLGLHAFLKKPFDIEEFLKITTLLTSRSDHGLKN